MEWGNCVMKKGKRIGEQQLRDYDLIRILITKSVCACAFCVVSIEIHPNSLNAIRIIPFFRILSHLIHLRPFVCFFFFSSVWLFCVLYDSVNFYWHPFFSISLEIIRSAHTLFFSNVHCILTSFPDAHETETERLQPSEWQRTNENTRVRTMERESEGERGRERVKEKRKSSCKC